MRKAERARLIRDAAVKILEREGRWEEARVPSENRSVKLLTARRDGLSISYHTPFQQVSTPLGERERYQVALLGGKENMPYGLDIHLDASGKVFNVEWSQSGEFSVIAFRRGEWEKLFKIDDKL